MREIGSISNGAKNQIVSVLGLANSELLYKLKFEFFESGLKNTLHR